MRRLLSKLPSTAERVCGAPWATPGDHRGKTRPLFEITKLFVDRGLRVLSDALSVGPG
jgi:hypothetical protein